MIWIYCVTGWQQRSGGITNCVSSYGYLTAASRAEAIGKAVEKFRSDNPSHTMDTYGVMEAPDLQVKP